MNNIEHLINSSRPAANTVGVLGLDIVAYAALQCLPSLINNAELPLSDEDKEALVDDAIAIGVKFAGRLGRRA